MGCSCSKKNEAAITAPTPTPSAAERHPRDVACFDMQAAQAQDTGPAPAPAPRAPSPGIGVRAESTQAAAKEDAAKLVTLNKRVAALKAWDVQAEQRLGLAAAAMGEAATAAAARAPPSSSSPPLAPPAAAAAAAAVSAVAAVAAVAAAAEEKEARGGGEEAAASRSTRSPRKPAVTIAAVKTHSERAEFPDNPGPDWIATATRVQLVGFLQAKATAEFQRAHEVGGSLSSTAASKSKGSLLNTVQAFFAEQASPPPTPKYPADTVGHSMGEAASPRPPPSSITAAAAIAAAAAAAAAAATAAAAEPGGGVEGGVASAEGTAESGEQGRRERAQSRARARRESEFGREFNLPADKAQDVFVLKTHFPSSPTKSILRAYTAQQFDLLATMEALMMEGEVPAGEESPGSNSNER